MAESWTLDGLALHDATFQIRSDGIDMTPPRQRQEWIGAADSEHQALVRDPFYENRTVVLPLQIVPQASKDLAFDKVGQIRDKLAKASQYQDGVALTWTSHGSARTVTFDVLAGEITELPVDFHLAFQNRPRLVITLTCKPFWRGTETLTSTSSSSTPFVTAELVNSIGDVPALGRLIVTDTATQSRRHVEWGLEGPLTYNAATSLLIDSDNLVTSGFAGTGSTRAGAYDPNSAGNTTVGATIQYNLPIAVCGTGDLSHVGSFRVKARIFGDYGYRVRLSWQVGDGPFASNAYAAPPASAGAGWWELDLGMITIPTVLSGTQRWTGRVDAYNTVADALLDLDYLLLVPVTDGYGKARATYSYQVGVTVARDRFTATTAGNALNGRTAEVGGTWATSGSATDFQFADSNPAGIEEAVTRFTNSDASRRFAILGAANFTDTEVSVEVMNVGGPAVSNFFELGVIARWVDSSNYLAVFRRIETFPTAPISVRTLYVEQVVAGAATSLANITIPASVTFSNIFHTIRLVVMASGSFRAEHITNGVINAEAVGVSSALATGGALASGKPGIFDRYTGTGATSSSRARFYDDFQVATPPPEPIVIYSGRNMQFRHDDTIRQDSTGTYTGRPQSYRGSRFIVPVGTSRVFVKARRNDVDEADATSITDATQIQVGVTPRGLAVPRA